MMSASLQSPEPTDTRRLAPGSSQVIILERRPTVCSHRRGAAEPVAMCVPALGVAAYPVRNARAETSANASASASATIARAEKGITDANASVTASQEAVPIPELRAKRGVALPEPEPVKPPQLNGRNAEDVAASVGYFLNLHHYVFTIDDTTEFAVMSDDHCKFYKSTIDGANDIHSRGGQADKWDQRIVSMTHYEKLEGYEYNRVKVIVNYGAVAPYYGDGQSPPTSEATYGQEIDFGIRYNSGGWMVGVVEVVSK